MRNLQRDQIRLFCGFREMEKVGSIGGRFSPWVRDNQVGISMPMYLDWNWCGWLANLWHMLLPRNYTSIWPPISGSFQVTWDRRRETRDLGQEACDKRQETRTRKRATGDMRKGNMRKETWDSRRETGDRRCETWARRRDTEDMR